MRVLAEARVGRLSAASIALLNTRLNAKLPDADGIEATILFPHKHDVERRNAERLLECDAATRQVFNAADEGDAQQREQLQKNCTAVDKLELRVKAQVILLKNLARVPTLDGSEVNLVNGERGVITEFRATKGSVGSLPVVKFSDNVHVLMGREKFSLEIGGVEVASRTQIPLGLAWALSVHKSQGMTISKLQLSISRAFEHGQSYVALSRCTSLAALSLIRRVCGRMRGIHDRQN